MHSNISFLLMVESQYSLQVVRSSIWIENRVDTNNPPSDPISEAILLSWQQTSKNQRISSAHFLSGWKSSSHCSYSSIDLCLPAQSRDFSQQEFCWTHSCECILLSTRVVLTKSHLSIYKFSFSSKSSEETGCHQGHRLHSQGILDIWFRHIIQHTFFEAHCHLRPWLRFMLCSLV